MYGPTSPSHLSATAITWDKKLLSSSNQEIRNGLNSWKCPFLLKEVYSKSLMVVKSLPGGEHILYYSHVKWGGWFEWPNNLSWHHLGLGVRMCPIRRRLGRAARWMPVAVKNQQSQEAIWTFSKAMFCASEGAFKEQIHQRWIGIDIKTDIQKKTPDCAEVRWWIYVELFSSKGARYMFPWILSNSSLWQISFSLEA